MLSMDDINKKRKQYVIGVPYEIVDIDKEKTKRVNNWSFGLEQWEKRYDIDGE